MVLCQFSTHFRHCGYTGANSTSYTSKTGICGCLRCGVTGAGILYAKYKSEKLMEHLKLFAARLNIPRLIRVCEEQQHWKELVFLYIAYDEYDNAALVMMAHSPVAWEHVQFKDVAVKVSIG